jgi:hypothetical protein
MLACSLLVRQGDHASIRSSGSLVALYACDMNIVFRAAETDLPLVFERHLPQRAYFAPLAVCPPGEPMRRTAVLHEQLIRDGCIFIQLGYALDSRTHKQLWMAALEVASPVRGKGLCLALRTRLSEFLSRAIKFWLLPAYVVWLSKRGRLRIRFAVPTMASPRHRPQYMVATGVKCIPQLFNSKGPYIGKRCMPPNEQPKG